MTIVSTLKGLAQDEDGAVLVEYSLLLWILLLAAIPTIGLIAGWISDQYASLDGALAAASNDPGGGGPGSGGPTSYCRLWMPHC
jgi:Flp pilus assembly pilin Flp